MVDADIIPSAQIVTRPVRGVALRQYAPTGIARILAEQAEYLEPETLDWLDAMPHGATLIDIGASSGIYSHYAAAARRAQVFSFEPESQNFNLFQVNNYLNSNLFGIVPSGFNIAIGASSGIGQIFCAKFGAGFHMKILDRPQRVNEEGHFTPEYTQAVLRISLDNFVAEYLRRPPNHLKIDVDGAEFEVVSGAAVTLKHPDLHSIMIELSLKGRQNEPVETLLNAAGFTATQRHQVRHARGGFYDDLVNCVFERR